MSEQEKRDKIHSSVELIAERLEVVPNNKDLYEIEKVLKELIHDFSHPYKERIRELEEGLKLIAEKTIDLPVIQIIEELLQSPTSKTK